MTKIFTAIAAAALIVGVVPAYAANENGAFKVSLAGLDLQSASGARMMLTRIRNAASQVCGQAPYIADLNGTGNWKACYDDTVGRAVTQLNAPMVTEAYKGPQTRTVASANAR